MLAHRVSGTGSQVAVCQLEPDQTVYCQAGRFLWKTANVSVETRLTKPEASGGGGGLLSAALTAGKRALAGESLAFQYYRANGTGLVAFAGVLPGELRALELDGSRGWYAEKDAFVAAESTVDFGIAFSGLANGLRSGGFVLEQFTGSGTVLIAGAGHFLELSLAKYGGTIQCDTGCVVAFEDTIRYSVERVGQLSASTMMPGLLGGEGFTLATLEGAGTVILQSLTIEGLAKALAKNLGNPDDRRGPLAGLLSAPKE